MIEPARQSLAESAGHLKDDITSTVRDAADEVKQTASDATDATVEQGKSSAQTWAGTSATPCTTPSPDTVPERPRLLRVEAFAVRPA